MHLGVSNDKGRHTIDALFLSFIYFNARSYYIHERDTRFRNDLNAISRLRPALNYPDFQMAEYLL